MTIKELSKLAGVSPATISRVTNNSGYVKAEVRERIEKLIEETGYVPNSIARNLKRKKTNIIGVIIPKISSETTGRVVEGITEIANQKGYELLLGNTRNKNSGEIEYLKILHEKRVDGILVLTSGITKEHIKVIKQIKIPTVFVGQDASKYNLPSVVQDEKNALFEMTNHLIKSGHKHIGFIGVDELDHSIGVLRKEGYKKAIKKAGLKENVFVGDFSVNTAYRGARELTAKNSNITAIVSVTDNLAIGAMNYFFDQGKKVPEDVSITGVGDTSNSALFNPRITTIHYNYGETGKNAADLLFKLIEDGKAPYKKLTLSYSLNERSSTKKL